MFFFLFLLFFYYSVYVINSESADFTKILDNSTIIISLETYNVFTPEGESIDSLHTLPPFTRTEIVLTKIPKDVHFVVLQVHSHLVNLTLSLDDVPFQNNSVNGTNLGLVKMNRKTDLRFYLIFNESLEELDVLVSVQAYSAEAPIPGGCNMEFQVEISPFLLTTYDDVVTDVNFAPSAPPLGIISKSPIYTNSECNIKPSPIHHQMYYRYFPERDFSKETYFDILKSLMTRGRILKNANLAKEKLTSPAMKRVFATYPGIGNAFVVVSEFENHTAVYVPSFTYGCDDLKTDNTCLVLTSTFSKVLCATVLFLGLFNCFFGHFFFRIEIFLFGFLAYGIIIHILVSLLFSSTIALSVSVSLGIFIAALKVIACTCFSLPITSVILSTSVLGFLLSSVIYYPIIDYVDLFVRDINFWGIFIGIVATCSVLMLCLAEKANIISCAFVGSYVGILSIDHYLGSNLRYIIMNTMRRAETDKFNMAIIGPPFQLKDGLLCLAWGILMLLGISMQKLLTKFKPPYPPPENQKNTMGKFLRSSTDGFLASERTPLIPGFPSNASGLF